MSNRSRWIAKRVARVLAVSTVGSALLAVGVVMLITPGPGLLLIFLAVAVFALEFTWAERLRQLIRTWVADQLSRTSTPAWLERLLCRLGILAATDDDHRVADDGDDAGETAQRDRQRSRSGSRAA